MQTKEEILEERAAERRKRYQISQDYIKESRHLKGVRAEMGKSKDRLFKHRTAMAESHLRDKDLTIQLILLQQKESEIAAEKRKAERIRQADEEDKQKVFINAAKKEFSAENNT